MGRSVVKQGKKATASARSRIDREEFKGRQRENKEQQVNGEERNELEEKRRTHLPAVLVVVITIVILLSSSLIGLNFPLPSSSSWISTSFTFSSVHLAQGNISFY